MKFIFYPVFLLLGIGIFLSSCRTQAESTWKVMTLHEIDSKIQSVAYGPLFEDGQSRLALVAADGRCLVIWREGTAWKNCELHRTPGSLSALSIGDADPETPGPDLIIGGSTGKVLRISLLKTGDVLVKLIYDAKSPIGDLAVHDLSPAHPGDEIIVLTEDGKATVLWRSDSAQESLYQSRVVLTDSGRLRNVSAGPYGPQGQPCALLVGVSGLLTRIYAVGADWRTKTVHVNADPLARLAVGDVDPDTRDREWVLVDDEGAVVLLRRSLDGFVAETIHREKKALRGVAVADFDPEAPGEEIAVFGYGMEVALFTKGTSGINRKVLFKDTDRGHWLLAGQLLPESKPTELIAVGYSGKVTLIYHEYIPQAFHQP